MFQDLTSLVADIGTFKTQVGYGGDDAPKIICSSYVSRFADSMDRQDRPKYSVGDKYLTLDRPDNEIESIFDKKGSEGYEYNWDRMQTFLEEIVQSQLRIDAKSYSVLLSQDVAAKPQEMKEIRQKMANFLFERLNVANIFFLKSPVLSCFATGRSTSLVVDSGQNFTRAVAVHDGFCLYKSAKTIAYGGKNVNKQIVSYVEGKINCKLQTKYHMSKKRFSQSFLDFSLDQLIDDIKQSLTVKRTEESGDIVSNTIEYELPDKQVITIDRRQIKDRFINIEPEHYQGYSYRGIPQMITDNINYCDIDIRKQLYSNILLTGGNILYGTLADDIPAKVVETAPPNVKVKSVSVCFPIERKYLSWIGGSIVTSLSSFQSYWVGNQEWKQNGSSIIDKKCN